MENNDDMDEALKVNVETRYKLRLYHNLILKNEFVNRRLLRLSKYL
jgi:hypothetical protein